MPPPDSDHDYREFLDLALRALDPNGPSEPSLKAARQVVATGLHELRLIRRALERIDNRESKRVSR